MREITILLFRAFSMYIPELPIQVVAVADSTKQDSTELMQALSIQVYLLQYGFETDLYPLIRTGLQPNH